MSSLAVSLVNSKVSVPAPVHACACIGVCVEPLNGIRWPEARHRRGPKHTPYCARTMISIVAM
jgi:hypothetical protein